MSFKELLTYILSIIPTIYLIKRYYLDSFNKKEIQDFEQLNKYFINERYKNFENESQLVKDMLCNTVSYFKGVNYDLVKYILEVKHINLFDFIKLIIHFIFFIHIVYFYIHLYNKFFLTY